MNVKLGIRTLDTFLTHSGVHREAIDPNHLLPLRPSKTCGQGQGRRGL